MTKNEQDEITRMFDNLRQLMKAPEDRVAVEQAAWAYWTGGYSDDGSYPMRRKEMTDERAPIPR